MRPWSFLAFDTPFKAKVVTYYAKKHASAKITFQNIEFGSRTSYDIDDVDFRRGISVSPRQPVVFHQNPPPEVYISPRISIEALAFDQDSHFCGSRKLEVRQLQCRSQLRRWRSIRIHTFADPANGKFADCTPVCAGPHQSAQGRTSLRRAAPVCAGLHQSAQGRPVVSLPPRCAQAPPQNPFYGCAFWPKCKSQKRNTTFCILDV